MTLQKLASIIAKREGKKSQVKIGDIREILRILIDLEAEALPTFMLKSGADSPGLLIITEASRRRNAADRKPKKKASKKK